jgi:hypothetical protein
MAPLTRKDVIQTIGDVDDVIVADIIATGATAQELSEAQSWVINDEALLNTGRPLPTGRIGQLVKLSGRRRMKTARMRRCHEVFSSR